MIPQLLSKLEDHKIKINYHRGKVKINGNRGTVKRFLPLIKEYKQQIIDHLKNIEKEHIVKEFYEDYQLKIAEAFTKNAAMLMKLKKSGKSESYFDECWRYCNRINMLENENGPEQEFAYSYQDLLALLVSVDIIV